MVSTGFLIAASVFASLSVYKTVKGVWSKWQKRK